MNQPFNDLSDAQAERLALLAEECAEVIQIVGKILRHGYESTHPEEPDGETNREMLEREIGHIHAATQLMLDNDDLTLTKIETHGAEKRKGVLVYLHHQ